VASDEKANLFRHSKCHHKMVAGETALQLPLQPLSAFEILALGTVTVAAGTEQEMFLAALLALIEETAVRLGLAVDHGGDNLLVLDRHGVSVEPDVLRGKGPEDLVNHSHGYPP